MGLAAGQHEHLQKQTNSFEKESYAVSRQQNGIVSGMFSETPVFRREEPAAAAGQLCTGTVGDGAEGVKGD